MLPNDPTKFELFDEVLDRAYVKLPNRSLIGLLPLLPSINLLQYEVGMLGGRIPY
jgi:hypothetical protein